MRVPFDNACPELGEGLRANGKKYLRHVANQVKVPNPRDKTSCFSYLFNSKLLDQAQLMKPRFLVLKLPMLGSTVRRSASLLTPNQLAKVAAY
jgi:hypothetical protein